MQVKQFEYVREIARRGSITQVADELYISRQALSESVRLLEQELGFAIFQRSNKGVVPTPEGEIVLKDLDMILPIVESWNKLSGKPKQKVEILIQYILSDSILGTNIFSEVSKNKDFDITWKEISGFDFATNYKENENCISIMLPSENGKAYNDIMALVERNANVLLEPLLTTDLCIVVSKESTLSDKKHLYLDDLRGRDLVRTKAANLSTPTRDMVLLTGTDGYIIPETTNLLNFVAKNENAFAFLPRITLKNNLMIQMDFLRVRCLEDYHNTKGQCYLVHNKQYLTQNQNILAAIRNNYHE